MEAHKFYSTLKLTVLQYPKALCKTILLSLFLDAVHTVVLFWPLGHPVTGWC